MLGCLAVVGCSSGSKHAAAPATAKTSPCGLIATLDDTAAKVAHADVSDPDAFTQTRNAAVNTYVTTVRELKAAMPGTYDDDLDRLEAAVHQYNFQDAVAPRAALDDYVAAHCGTGAASTTTTTTTVAARS